MPAKPKPIVNVVLHRNSLRFLDHCRKECGLSENTLKAYRADIATWLGSADPAAVAKDELAAAMRARTRGGASSATVVRGLSVMRNLMEFLDSDAALPLDAPRMGRRLPKAFDMSECDRMLEAAAGDLKAQAVLQLLWDTGIRASEVGTIRVRDVCMGFVTVIGKGNAQRQCPVGAACLRTLERWIEATGNEDLLFPGMDRHAVDYICSKYGAKAGVHRATPHRWRHSFATHMLKGGADLRLIQELMGHSSVTTTTIYTKLDIDDLRRTIERYHPLERTPSRGLRLAGGKRGAA